MKSRRGLQALMISLGVAFCTLASATGISVPPPGVYSFSGSCMDCPPAPSPATAELIVPSASISGASFRFVSSNFASGLNSAWIEVLSLGPINAGGHADASILFGSGGSTYYFTSDQAGNWNLLEQALSADRGDQGIWATRPVPEPATYAMWMLAGGLLLVARSRRSKV